MSTAQQLTASQIKERAIFSIEYLGHPGCHLLFPNVRLLCKHNYRGPIKNGETVFASVVDEAENTVMLQGHSGWWAIERFEF